MFKEYWNETHKKYSQGAIIYDDWLDKYNEVLDKTKLPILDLGCGCGNDTKYLIGKGFKVIACDYSEIAIETIKNAFNTVEAKLVDISKPLPFKDNSFDLIIADLSLHYFDEKTTKSIMLEIKRILTLSGTLLARVNSINDINYGAQQGVKLEENYYFVDGYNKRFFDVKDAEKFFSIIGGVQIKESTMLRYSKPKQVIEIMVKNKNGV